MVNYSFASNDPRLAQVRALAAKIRAQELAKTVTTKSGTFNVGRGVAVGNIKGFDLDAYRKAVEAGTIGSQLRAQALEDAGQHQIYRTQPQVQQFIENLSHKQDVSDSEISHARGNTSVLKTAQDIRNAVIDTHPDPASVIHEVTPVSAEGVINMRTNNLAPVAHPLYEQQSIDDMVSNTQGMTATPDEAVLPQNIPAPPQDNGIPPEQAVYDDMINANNAVEPDDSSGTGFTDYSSVDLGDVEQ